MLRRPSPPTSTFGREPVTSNRLQPTKAPTFSATPSTDRFQAASKFSIATPSGAARGSYEEEWQRQLGELDEQEVELHLTQMKMMREQMTGFLRGLAEAQDAINDLKLQREAEVMQMQSFHEELHRDKETNHAELMALIQALQSDHRTHTSKLDDVANLVGDGVLEERLNENHAALEGRLDLLHQAHGEAVQAHGTELAALRDAHDLHSTRSSGYSNQVQELHATIPERLAYIEQFMGDSADKHDAALAKLEHMHGRMASCESLNESFGKLHNEKEEKHATLQERVEYLEEMLGDNADKHAKELEALKKAHDKHANALSGHNKLVDSHKDKMAGHHATLQERVDDIEKLLGLEADKHDEHGNHLADTHSRFDELHNRLSVVEKFGAILEELKSNHGGLQREKRDLAGHHASLKDRLDDLEGHMNGSLDKHGDRLRDFMTEHDKHVAAFGKYTRDLEHMRADKTAHHEALNQRFDGLERAHGEAADRHAEGLSQVHAKHRALLDDLGGQKHGHHIGNLQRSHDALAAKKVELEERHATMGDRVGYLEQMLGDSVEKHAKELQQLKTAHSKQGDHLDGLKTLHAKHQSVDERLDYLEQVIGDSADKHADEVTQLRQSHDALHGRLAAAETQNQALGELRRSHGGLAAQKAQLETHHASLKERVDFLEGVMNDSADKHTEKLEDAHARLNEMHGRVLASERSGQSMQDLKKGHAELHDHKRSMEEDHTAVKDRLDTVESLMGDATNRHAKELKALRTSHDKHIAVLTRQGGQLDGVVMQQEQHASLPERLAFVEQQLGDSADKHFQGLSEVHKKIANEKASRETHHGSLREAMARDQEDRANHHASLNERVDFLERAIGDNADKHGRELSQVLSGHQKLAGELKTHGSHREGLLEKVVKVEKSVGDVADKTARESQAMRAKFESFSTRMLAVKDAWESPTPRIG